MKLLTEFDGNPKVVQVGLAGAGLYARSLAYCGKYETDGFIPETWVQSTLALEQELKHLPKHLLDVCLWKRAENGYEIPDYLDVNKSKRDMKKLSVTRSRAGKRGGQAKAVASAKANAKQNPSSSVSPSFKNYLEHYKETTGREVRGSSAARSSFDARLKDGYTVEELKLATEGAWADEFLRENGHVVPETLLRASKVGRYVQMGQDRSKPKGDPGLARLVGRDA